MFAAAAAVILRRPERPIDQGSRRLGNLTLALGAFLILHSIAFSPFRDVSILKAISWTMISSTVILGWAGISVRQRKMISDQIFLMLVFVSLVSFLFYLTGVSAAYIPRSDLLMGVLAHSQALGLSMAILGCWSAMRLLAQQRPSWALLSIAGISGWLVLMSGARTGGLAMVLSVVLVLFLAPFLSGKQLRILAPGIRSPRFMITLAVGALLVALNWQAILQKKDEFITKGVDVAGVAEAYQLSRGPLIEEMLANIRERPFTGIGFGIASQPQTMWVIREPLLGLPTSAFVEKGVMPVAVFEEIGLFGGLFLLVWTWFLVKKSAKSGIPELSIVLVILLINMGEATFFSPGGVGLLALVLMGWATSGGFNRELSSS